jgi:hypothetical protein
MRSLLTLTLALLLLPLPALAQQSDEQLWLQANASTEIAQGTRLTLESIGRFSDSAGGFSHDEFGGMATFQVAEGVEVSIGYRHVDDYDHGRARPNEERLRQMVVVQLGGGFAGRLRFEQRFQASGTETAFRVRPQLRYTLPLGEKGVQLFASQEHFLNFNDTRWGVRSGYERMRNAVGLTVPLSSKLKADVGYLNQYRFGRARARDQMDHAATFTLTLTLDGIVSGHHGDAD